MIETTLLDDFPRSMGHPRQDIFVYNNEERDAYVRKYIKKCDLYVSVYAFKHVEESGYPDRSSAVIDKIFFDFDGDNWLEDAKKVHVWCAERNVIHRTHFSGRGGQAFIFIDPDVENKKEAVGNFQRYMKTTLGLDLDKKVIGDTSRIFRYPNTYNFSAMRYCIAFPPAWLDNGLTIDYLRKKATKQQHFDPWCGEELLDLSEFDVPDLLYCDEEVNVNFDPESISDSVKTDYPQFPPCVQSWMSTPVIDDETKFLLAVYLKDQTAVPDMFSPQDIASVLKSCLSTGEYNHYFGTGRGDLPRRHPGHRGIKFRSAMRKDYYLPDCDTLRKIEMTKKNDKGEIVTCSKCPQDCGRRHPIYG